MRTHRIFLQSNSACLVLHDKQKCYAFTRSFNEFYFINRSRDNTMTTLQELLAQKEALEQQISQIKKLQREDALREARELVETYELTTDELFGKRKAAGQPAAAKYRNPESGETWSGRGRTPRWLDGKNREDFAI